MGVALIRRGVSATQRTGDRSRMTKTIFRPIFLGILALLIASCGGSNDDLGSYQPPTGFTGRYLGANLLGAAQNSILTLYVTPTGQASGTLTVQNNVAAQTTIIPAGYPVSGTVNMTTGAFNLSGSFPGGISFSISGTINGTTLQGTYSITYGGQTYQGNLQPASQGTPNPPTNPNPPTDGTTHMISGGTLSEFNFTAGVGYNGTTPPVGASSLIAGAFVEESSDVNTVNIVLSDVLNVSTQQIRSLTVGVTLHNGQQLQVGQTYQLVSDANGDGAYLSLQTSTGTTVNEAWTSTAGISGGWVKINAINTNSIDLSWAFDAVVANSEVTPNPAQGSFNCSGRIVANFVNLP